MSQFSTNESVSLEKRIEITSNITKTDNEHINYIYEIDKCAKWIIENDYKKVCLQFPDNLLADSGEVVKRIENIIGSKVYILGDTAYESCCIDYTAAKHISADAIIHFGVTCFSKPENIIPCLNIHEKFDFNVEKFSDNLKNKFTEGQNVIVLLNTPYLHKMGNLKQILIGDQFNILSVEGDLDITDKIIVYLGQNDRKLMNINLSFNTKELFYFDPNSTEILNYEQDMKILKRRFFLMEKIKDSNTIGIVISTLAVKNYLKMIERLKTLIKIHSKKYYIISVGKPTVAKLANFPEVDVFVVIGCAMNEIYENREFYKPIVTPFDLESALNPKLQNAQFSYDFNKFLIENNEITDEIMDDFKQSDVSLLTGKVRHFKNDSSEETNEDLTDENKIAIRNEGTVQISDNFGAGFLANRSWKGLEQCLGKTEPQIAEKGRKGIAQSYQNETG